MRTTGILLLSGLRICCLAESGSLLTTREAAQIVEALPNVEDARQKGLCPTTQAAVRALDNKIAVQVRDVCSKSVSTFGGNFLVDRSNGEVSDEATEQPAAVPAGVVDKVFAAHRARLLTREEVGCLVRWTPEVGTLVHRGFSLALYPNSEGSLDADIEGITAVASGPLGVKQKFRFTVDRISGEIRRAPYDELVDSMELSRLRSEIIESHATNALVLSGDAETIVAASPEFARLAKAGQSPVAAVDPEFHGALDHFVRVWGAPTAAQRKQLFCYRVDRITGEVRDTTTDHEIDTSAVQKARDEVLKAARSRRADATTRVRLSCEQQDPDVRRK